MNYIQAQSLVPIDQNIFPVSLSSRFRLIIQTHSQTSAILTDTTNSKLHIDQTPSEGSRYRTAANIPLHLVSKSSF